MFDFYLDWKVVSCLRFVAEIKANRKKRADCCVTDCIFSDKRGLNGLMSQHLFPPAVIIVRGGGFN